MKIIEGMKEVKSLLEKADDLRKKIKDNSAHTSVDRSPYADAKKQIAEWLQMHSDVLKNVSDLKYRIQKTNLTTHVTFDIGGSLMTKTISEWIFRRTLFSDLEKAAWEGLTPRNLKATIIPSSIAGVDPTKIDVILNYDTKEKDAKVETFRSEIGRINGALEVVNATTDLVEL